MADGMTGMPDGVRKATPMYLRIRHAVQERIESGRYPVGSAIPSENELAAEFGTTRLTVRNAIDVLVERGLIRRVQGKGAFVSHRWMGSFNSISGFREEVKAGEGVAGVRQLSKSKRLAGEWFAHLFGIEPDDVLYTVRRLNSINGVPVSLEQAYIPLRFFDGIEDIDVSVFSLYETYEMYGRKVVRAQEKLDVAVLSARDAGLLQVEPGSLALALDSVSYDASGQAIEYAYALNRGDHGGYFYRY